MPTRSPCWKQLAADFPTRPEFRRDLARATTTWASCSAHGPAGGSGGGLSPTALALQKQLAADFPDRPEFRQDAGQRATTTWASCSTPRSRLKEAEAAYGDALAIRKQLAADFPTRPEFRQALARSHNNLGDLLRPRAGWRKRRRPTPTRWPSGSNWPPTSPPGPSSARSWPAATTTWASCSATTGRLKEAEAAYHRARPPEATGRRLPHPARVPPGAGQQPQQPGHPARDTGRLKEAEAAYADALALQKQLAADFPTRPEFRQELARSHNNLGILLHDTGRLKEAEAAYADALALRSNWPPNSRISRTCGNELADTAHEPGDDSDLRQRDFKAAKAYLDEAGPHHEAALKANPRHPDYRQPYRNNLTALIRANAGLGDPAGAKQAAEKLRDLGWDPPGNAYDAARALALCIPIVRRRRPSDQGRARQSGPRSTATRR